MDFRIQEPAAVVVRARTDLRATLRSERGTEFHFVEDPLRNTFYRLGKAEFALLRALDGERTLEEAVAFAVSRHSDALNLEQSLALCKWLVDAGLATTETSQSIERVERNARKENAHRLRRVNPWFVRVSLGSPERMLKRLAPLGSLLLSRGFFYVWLAATIGSTVVVAGNWPEITSRSPLVLGWRGACRLLVIWGLLKLMHELAHALACRHVGGRVGNVGIAFVLGMPSPFVDVSTVWRCPDRRSRILVSLAGVYVETFFAALAMIAWSCSVDGVLRQTLLAGALVASVSTLVFNLNPLMRFDGYFALADWTDVANLAARSRAEALRMLQRNLLGLDEPLAERRDGGEPKWLAYYGLAAMLWRGIVVVGLFSWSLYQFGLAATLLISVIPAVIAIRQGFRGIRAAWIGPKTKFHARRAALVWSGGAVVASAAFYFCDPRVLEIPAVVEYEPLGTVRTVAPGFVREIFVRDGDHVVAGTPLIRLENESLAAEVRQTELVVQQHFTRTRMHRQAGAVAKEQAEDRQREAVEVKLTHLQERAESLIIRAPTSGRVVSRGLKDLLGRWLSEGSDVAAVGIESSKQVVAALPQNAAQAFAEADGVYTMSLKGSGRTIEVPKLHVDPRADCAVIHPALSVEQGGDIAVRRRNTSRNGADAEKTLVSEFHEPHFRLTGSLDQAAAATLASGRTATLQIRTTWHGTAVRWWSRIDAWLSGAGGDHQATADAGTL